MAQVRTRAELEEFIMTTLATFGPERRDIHPGAALEQLDIDSLDLVELGQVIEDEYGVQLEAKDFKGVVTVGDSIGVIAHRVGV